MVTTLDSQALRRSGASGLGSLGGEVTSFVGRQREAAEVRALLADSRLVTLTGTGGVGKSRLARRVAQGLRGAYSDGVWVVELAGLGEPTLLSQTILAALEVRDQSAREPNTVLIEYLADKRLLLMLDNCEHLVDECARLVAEVLAGAPWVRILATSRESLGIAGEQVWSVPPLSVPGFEEVALPRELRQYEAVQLFEERAARALPGFSLGPGNEVAVASVCQRLDGLPLAIELAAVWTRTLSVEQILERLEDCYRLLTTGNRDASPRHRTLHAAVEWSFGLCSQEERRLWARLSVFPGEFDLAAAQRVCGDDELAGEDVFEGLAGLVEKSVLLRTQEHAGRARYRLLETLRQFGREQLDGDREATLRRRHRDYYLALAEQAALDWFGPNQITWSARLRAERVNLWAALDYCLTTAGEARTGLRMASSLWFQWMACGYLREGRHWLNEALARDTAGTRERARALWAIGYVAIGQGEASTGLRLLQECRELAQRLGDKTALAYGTQFAGLAEVVRGERERGLALLEEALQRQRTVGTPNGTATALFYLALAHCHQGNIDRAIALAEECRAICAAYEESWCLARAFWVLGLSRRILGELHEASVDVQQALRLQQALNDRLGSACCVEFLAWTAARSDPHRAATLLGASAKLWSLLGRFLFGLANYLNWHEQCETHVRAALGETRFEDGYRRGWLLGPDEAVAYALGEPPTTPSTATAQTQAQPELTPREWQVAELVAQGSSNKDIAGRLVIARRTAEGHIQHIFTKLDFTSRAQIAAWVMQQKLGHPSSYRS